MEFEEKKQAYVSFSLLERTKLDQIEKEPQMRSSGNLTNTSDQLTEEEGSRSWSNTSSDVSGIDYSNEIMPVEARRKSQTD